MGGHARVGRTYAGRVLQLITGSTGLDDWEWGVTLLADDPVALKEIVYEMRFDPVSADYAEFGPFVTGLLLEPAEGAAPRRAAERRAERRSTMSEHVRLFVSFPEELVDRPMIYEVVKRFDVVPNIRRANVEQHSGWVILELNGEPGTTSTARSPTSKRSAAPSTRWKATSSRDDAVRRGAARLAAARARRATPSSPASTASSPAGSSGR